MTRLGWASIAVVLAAVGCGGDPAAAEHPAGKEGLVPLAWQRAVRVNDRPDEIRLVYVTEPGRLPRRWKLETHGEVLTITLLTRPRRKHEREAAITGCVTLRSSAFAAGKRLEDGAVAGKPASERRALHNRDDRRDARQFPATADNCPVLQRR